jgi:hypothetical protein
MRREINFLTEWDRKNLITRMHSHGFILDNEHFHRHIYILSASRNSYSDIIKLEDAQNWLDNLSNQT